MTAEDLTDWLETTIDDSFDLGWTSRDAARLIVSRMHAEGLVMAPAHPAADLVEALKRIERLADRCGDLPDTDGFRRAYRDIAVMAGVALSRYAKGGA